VSLTNTSGATGNYQAGCAIYDYGADGLTPGPNIVTFSTFRSNVNQGIARSPMVWPALRAYQDAGIGAWDNFLVYKANSKPVITLPLADTTVAFGGAASFSILADGPGTISYAWYTNNILVSGATDATYMTPPLDSSYSNLLVVASNGNGSTSNSAAIIITGSPPAAPDGLSATAGNSQVSLTWNPSSSAANYNVKSSTTSGGPYSPVASPAGTSYTDTGLANGTTYYYVISAVNAFGESPDSSEAAATPVEPPPIVLTVGPQVSGQFSFSFPGQNNQSYVVESSTNLTDWIPVLTNTPVNGVFNFTESNATDPARFYRVRQ